MTMALLRVLLLIIAFNVDMASAAKRRSGDFECGRCHRWLATEAGVSAWHRADCGSWCCTYHGLLAGQDGLGCGCNIVTLDNSPGAPSILTMATGIVGASSSSTSSSAVTMDTFNALVSRVAELESTV